MFYKTPDTKLYVGKIVLSCMVGYLLLIYLSGCTSTHSYKTLSFFFDGVPNPQEKISIHKLDSLTKADSTVLKENLIVEAKPLMNFHSPYQSKECASCHDQSTMGKFTMPQPELCYQCHDNFKNAYKVLHGPVGGGQCTECHNPHQSLNENLLTRTNQAICTYCHDLEQLIKLEVHRKIKDVSCLECHNPHGGENKNILR
jgi:predicted CXXCH cytochrome family protein